MVSENFGKNEAHISRLCTNKSQSPLEMLVIITNILKVDVKDLFVLIKK